MQRKLDKMDSSAILDAISQRSLVDEIEQLARKTRPVSSMSRELRELYQRFSWKGRASTARGWLYVVTLVNVPVVAIDYLMSPTLLVPGLVLRCFAIPIVGFVALQSWTSPRPQWAEALSIIGFSACMMALACTLGSIAGGDIHERYVAACFMVVSTSIAVVALMGVWPVLACLVNAAAYAVSQLLNPSMDPTTVASMTLFYGAVTLSLVRARTVANRVHVRSVMSHFRDLFRMEELRRANLKLHEMATRDALTGLLNRATIIGHLADVLDKPEASGLVSVALIDIDHFKKLNDTLGHLEGDRCLRIVAGTLGALAEARQGVVGRYGGEEFLLVLPNTESGHALYVCEELRQGIERLGLPSSDEPDAAPVTISLGVVSSKGMRNGEVTVNALLQAADEALYTVKRGGRNDVRLARSG